MMRVEQVLAVLCLVAIASAYENYFRMPSPYQYSCIQHNCHRHDRNEKQQHKLHHQSPSSRSPHHLTADPHAHPHEDHHEHNEEYNTLHECLLTCGEYGSLWPRPSKIELAKRTFSLPNCLHQAMKSNRCLMRPVIISDAIFILC